MYEDIGNKIKGLSKALFYIEAIAFIIYGIILLSNELTRLTGVILLIAGPLLSWLSSWTLYGFGEIVDFAYRSNNKISKSSKTIAKEKEQNNYNNNLQKLLEEDLITYEEFKEKLKK